MDSAENEIKLKVQSWEKLADQQYPGWREGKCQFNLIPAIRISQTDIPRHYWQESNAKGEDGEREVFALLGKKLPDELGFHPMVICSPKRQEFRSFLRKDLPKTFQKSSKNLPNTEIEITDFMVFDMTRKILSLIEVKSATGGVPSTAFKQLDTAEEFFEKLWEEFSEKMKFPPSSNSLKIVKIVFLPNMSKIPEVNRNESVKLFCGYELTAEYFMQKYLYENKVEGSNRSEEYFRLWNGFVAMCIRTKNQPTIVSEQGRRLDEQSPKFLEKSKQFKNYAGEYVEVKLPDPIAAKFKFLTKEQADVWYGPKYQLIYGLVGTGKTVLVLYKLIEQAQKKELCFFLYLHDDLKTLYVEMLKDVNDDCNVHMVKFDPTNPGESSKTIAAILQATTGPFNIFSDENTFYGTWKTISGIILESIDRLNYMWVAIPFVAIKQLFTKTNTAKNEETIKLIKETYGLPEQIKTSLLWTHMRSTPQIFQYFATTYSEEYSHEYAVGHHVLMYPIDYWETEWTTAGACPSVAFTSIPSHIRRQLIKSVKKAIDLFWIGKSNDAHPAIAVIIQYKCGFSTPSGILVDRLLLQNSITNIIAEGIQAPKYEIFDHPMTKNNSIAIFDANRHFPFSWEWPCVIVVHVEQEGQSGPGGCSYQMLLNTSRARVMLMVIDISLKTA